ncbi:MAG TPA: VWA domain-containing protein [Candidatus Angelobacter sp.]|nr:VWA domain-containing protein [Candidatus Angelobacter sp.]
MLATVIARAKEALTIGCSRECGLIFLVLMFGSLVWAQEKTEQKIPRLRTQSNEVLVPTLVKDRDGKLIFGLKASDFIIEDDGVAQQISMDEAEPEEPVSLLIAIQTGRMALFEFQRMKKISSLLDQIVGQPQVETAIVTFDSDVNLLQDFTFESEQTETYLRKMMAGPLREMGDSGNSNGAAIYDAVRYSVHLLQQQPDDSRRILLLISETRDHGSHAVKLDDAIAAIGDSNTVIYSVAFSPTASTALDTLRGEWDARTDPAGPNLDVWRLMKMAREAMRKNAPRSVAAMTGGEYDLFTSEKTFERFMNEFANHLHSRYRLRFQPKDPRPGLHQIRVKVKQRNDVTIVARRTYWVTAPKAAP